MRKLGTSLIPLVLPGVFASLAGCSPAPDPIAQGQAHYTLKEPKVGTIPDGKHCGKSGGEAGIGAVKPLVPGGATGVPELPPPPPGEPSNAGGPVANGNNDYSVSCEMTVTEGEVEVDIKLDGVDVLSELSGNTNIHLVGKIDTKTGEGSGSVGYFNTEIFNVAPASGTQCSLHVVRDLSAASQPKQLDTKKGKIWVTFECPGVTLTGDQGAYCASYGTVVASNCALR